MRAPTTHNNTQQTVYLVSDQTFGAGGCARDVLAVSNVLLRVSEAMWATGSTETNKPQTLALELHGEVQTLTNIPHWLYRRQQREYPLRVFGVP